MDEMTLTLNSPLTEEDWDVITDVDFDCTNKVWFHTKHGKDVEFVKVVRCGECKWMQCNTRPDGYLPNGVDEYECLCWHGGCDPTDFCSYGERREES